MASIQVFIVGRVLKRSNGYIAWQLRGIFPDQTTAVNKCVNQNDFYASVMTEVDLQAPVNDPPIPGGVFPLA